MTFELIVIAFVFATLGFLAGAAWRGQRVLHFVDDANAKMLDIVAKSEVGLEMYEENRRLTILAAHAQQMVDNVKVDLDEVKANLAADKATLEGRIQKEMGKLDAKWQRGWDEARRLLKEADQEIVALKAVITREGFCLTCFHRIDAPGWVSRFGSCLHGEPDDACLHTDCRSVPCPNGDHAKEEVAHADD